MMEERKTRIRSALSQKLVDCIGLKCSRCAWGSQRSTHYSAVQAKHGALGILEVPISSFVNIVEASTFPSSEMMLRDVCPGIHQHWETPAKHNSPEYAETFAAKFESLKAEFSLCLSCMRLMDGSEEVCGQHGNGSSHGDDK